MKKFYVCGTVMFLAVFLLTSCASNEEKLLDAAGKGNFERVESLIKLDVNVNAKNSDGMAVLHLLSQEDNLPLVIKLLEKGAYVNAKDNKGRTPLYFSAVKGNVDLSKVLIENEADVNTRDEAGITPLHLASKAGDEILVRLLIEHGADPTLTGEKGEMPADLALESGHEKLAGLIKDVIKNIQAAETAVQNNNFFMAAEKYKSSGIFKKAEIYYIKALESSDKKNYKTCIVTLGKIGSEKAYNALEGFEKNADPETEKILSFVLKRHRGEKLKILMISLGESGRRAIDGYLASVAILTELVKLEEMKEIEGFSKIFENAIGKDNYVLEKIKVPTIKDSSAPPQHTIDKEQFTKYREEKEYDILVTSRSNWYEHTKYIRYSWEKPPLKMDIKYSYQILIPSLNEDKIFSYKLFHQEPSEFGMDSKKKMLRKKTATIWAGKEADAFRKINGFFCSIF